MVQMQEIVKPVFLVSPHRGGTFSVYASLRGQLEQRGILLDWLGNSPLYQNRDCDPAFREFLKFGTWPEAGDESLEALGNAMLRTFEQRGYNVVFVNILTSPVEMSLVAYLPPSVRRIAVVHNITLGTYSAARAVLPYVHAAVGVSPRIAEDLVQKLGFPAQTTCAIPNAMSLAPYDTLVRPARMAPLRLLSLGRVVDIDKGIFWLPDILHQLSDLDVHLTIAGDGQDLEELKKRCSSLRNRVSFVGRVAPREVPSIMNAHDVFLLPSRFEGFGYTLIEAMAARCVPVASSLRGVTDFVVKHDRTGLLFPVGDVAAAANAVRKLAGNSELCRQFGDAGRQDVYSRFSGAAMGDRYLEVIEKVMTNPRPIALRSPHAKFKALSIGGTWRQYVPKSLKNRLRNWLYRS